MPRKKTSTRKVTPAMMDSDYTVNSTNQPIVNSGPSTLLVILLIIVSFFAGYLFFKLKSIEQGTGTTTATTQAQPAAATVNMDQLKKLFTKDYIHFGDANKKLLFVEITDPSCPFCHVAAGQDPELSGDASFSGGRFKYASQGGTYVPPVTEMKKLVDEGKASMAFVYSPGHGNGELGMQALYCANDKGKFWEVHDLLMSNAGYNMLNTTVQNDKNNIPQLVEFLGGAMDSAYLSDCLTSGKYAKNLARDTQTGQSLGFSGTPHFFVNTTAFKGAYSFTDMQSSVKAAL